MRREASAGPHLHHPCSSNGVDQQAINHKFLAQSACSMKQRRLHDGKVHCCCFAVAALIVLAHCPVLHPPPPSMRPIVLLAAVWQASTNFSKETIRQPIERPVSIESAEMDVSRASEELAPPVLHAIESQRAISVLEDAREKLLFLSRITPSISEHKQELSQAVGDEISKLMHEQQVLEARYEELTRARQDAEVRSLIR